MIRYASTCAGLALLEAQKTSEAVKAVPGPRKRHPTTPTAYGTSPGRNAALGEKTKAGEALKKASTPSSKFLAVDPPLPNPAGDPAVSLCWK